MEYLRNRLSKFKKKHILKSSHKVASIESKTKPYKETWNFDVTTRCKQPFSKSVQTRLYSINDQLLYFWQVI